MQTQDRTELFHLPLSQQAFEEFELLQVDLENLSLSLELLMSGKQFERMGLFLLTDITSTASRRWWPVLSLLAY